MTEVTMNIFFFFLNSNDTAKIRDGDDASRRNKIFQTQTGKKHVLTRSQLLF